jgi:hypothetical protein
VAPVVSFGRIFVFPVAFLLSPVLPKHQVHHDLVHQRQANISRYLYPLLIGDAVLVKHNEMGKQPR